MVEDIVPFIKTSVPPPLRYPLADRAFGFIKGLMFFFYGYSLSSKVMTDCALMKS